MHVPNYIEDDPLGVSNWNESDNDLITDAYVTTVYNFEVEDYHTYFVSEYGYWVHDANHVSK